MAGRALATLALALAALFLWSSAAQAAPPPNDAFADAVAVGEFPPTGAIGVNAEATKEAGEPNHAGNAGGHSVWYSWTPKANQRVSVRTANSCFGELDALVAVYTGPSVDALTPVASNESPFAGCLFAEPAQAEFAAVADTTYWIAVDGRDGDEGSFELLLNPPPANDDFANATSIGAEPPQDIGGTTRLADKEAGEPNHAGDPGGHSVWYTWTPTQSGPVDISTCSSFSNLDAALAVYTGAVVDALTPVAANDDGPENPGFPGCALADSQVSIDVTAGTTYRIAVDAASGAVGRFTLRIRGRPQNDDFANPRVLNAALPSSATQVTNKLASKESGEPNHAGNAGGHSVWFEWTPSSSGPVAISTCTPEGDLDTLLAVYTGSTLSGLTAVASNDDDANGRCLDSNSEVRFTATAGTTYRIAVDGKNGEEGRFDLFVEGPPANDAFANAQPLSAGLPAFFGNGSTRFASEEAGEPDHAGVPGGKSVWFSWTPSSSGQVAISICPFLEVSPDTVLAVYTGSSVDALTAVTGNDDSPAACKSTGSQVELSVTAGTTYRIAVDSKDGNEGPFLLDISGPPANDDFEDASVLPLEPLATFGSTVFADKEAGEPDHAGNQGGHSLWYSWTPSESGLAKITACGRSAGVDPLLAVYTGSAVNALSSVASNDDAPGEPEEEFCKSASGFSQVALSVTAGTTYRIAVDTKNSEGPVDLFFELTPANDDFADAQQLFSGLPSSGLADIELASKESGEPHHAGNAGGHSVWFEWTPTQSVPVAVSTCSRRNDDLDTLLAVYTGSGLGVLTTVGSDDDGTGDGECRGTDSEVQFNAVAGTTYRIAVDGKNGTTGFFQLLLEGRSANDDFGKPQTLGGALPALWVSSNNFAGKQAGEPDHAGGAGGSSVWFKWTAPRTEAVTVETCESSFDTLLAVYTGSVVNALTPVASNDEGGGKCSPRSRLSFDAVANTVYRIAVDGKAGAQGRLKLNIKAGIEFEPPVDGGGGGGGGTPPAVSPPPAADPPPPTRKPKPIKCKRGFKKKIVKGKPRCVKKKKKKKRRR